MGPGSLHDIDLLIGGAGPVGCVLAERAAHLLGWKVLLIDRRSHLAGNCHEQTHASGLRVHAYGPHYFRTNDASLIEYLSRFTEWIPGNYIVRSQVGSQQLPFPINLNTLEQLTGRSFDADGAAQYLAERRVPIAAPRDSEEWALSQVGRELYETFYKEYTRKQWGMAAKELDPSVCGRCPVRLNRDDRYVEHRYQQMPKEGFTALFERMVDHPNIRVLLGSDFFAIKQLVRPRRALVYTGPIDGYFGHCYGRLPYRSLRFEFETREVEYAQPCVQINYPGAEPYTRSVEYKHVTGQSHPHTVVAYERPGGMGEPFYPVPTAASRALYERYRQRAEELERRERIFFCGRLAQYRYFNTDEVIQEALACFERIVARTRDQEPQKRAA